MVFGQVKMDLKWLKTHPSKISVFSIKMNWRLIKCYLVGRSITSTFSIPGAQSSFPTSIRLL
jgi:hypothetical protein